MVVSALNFAVRNDWNGKAAYFKVFFCGDAELLEAKYKSMSSKIYAWHGGTVLS